MNKNTCIKCIGRLIGCYTFKMFSLITRDTFLALNTYRLLVLESVNFGINISKSKLGERRMDQVSPFCDTLIVKWCNLTKAWNRVNKFYEYRYEYFKYNAIE